MSRDPQREESPPLQGGEDVKATWADLFDRADETDVDVEAIRNALRERRDE